MDREDMLAGLRAVGERLEARGLQGEMYVVGGAAIALAYNARRVTKDIGAVFEPKMEIYAIAALVAEELGLPDDWLNDAVKGLLAGPDPYEPPVIELPGLRCLVASPQILLALKVLAHRRDVDGEDVRLLATLLGLTKPDEVLDLAERILSPNKLTLASQLFVEEVMASQ